MKKKPVMTNDLMRSFGRVNGRKLRDGQQELVDNLLPKLSVDIAGIKKLKDNGIKGGDPLIVQKIFYEQAEQTASPANPSTTLPINPIFLEIGFGYGEHLVGMAQKYPDVNFIGCEPFINGVATILKHIKDTEVRNIRLLHGDARLLMDELPEGSIDRLFILFPDPWPKAKHHKKRFINAEILENLARVIKSGGRLDIATDHVDYGVWIAEHLSNQKYFSENEIIGAYNIPDDWVETRYQQKARVQGREARFFNYVKV